MILRYCDWCGERITGFYVTDINIKNSIGASKTKFGDWHIECVDNVLSECCKKLVVE